MTRVVCLMIVGTVLTAGLSVVSTTGALQTAVVDTPPTATGIVYHDENGNQTFDAGEKVLPGVRVSNGQQITTTDQDGRYTLPISDDTIIFVIKPRNWRTPLDENHLPKFSYIHKPGGSPLSKFAGVAPTGPLPSSVDFPLYPQDEPNQFKAVLFGDPQPRNQTEVDYIAHDVVEELIGSDAAFGVTLGDIVFDDLTVLDAMNQTVAMIGIPWYNVVGNHDVNSDAKEPRYANETFERIYGPSYYSFDYGPTHFIVIDNIEWVIPQNGGRSTYRGGLGAAQLEFIKTDLAQIPEDQMVVLMMHIPIIGVHDRHDLYRLIEKRPLCISISGHTHTHEHVWINDADGWKGPKPHHHIINVTVSGSWWGGAPDERGIPHTAMADGGPNGYSILNFNGDQYHLDYVAAGRGADYQMEIDVAEVVTQAQAAETYVFANVFNGDQHTAVTFTLGDSDPIAMQHVREADPKYQRTTEREAQILATDKSLWRKLPKPKASTHLWKALLPADVPQGTHTINVTAVDRHGRTFTDHRILRVE